MIPAEVPAALPLGQADTWISLGDAAAIAVDAAARAFQTDSRDRPADADDTRLFPFACPLPEYD